MQIERDDVEFASSGETCRGWLYTPRSSTAPLPCIVMAPGFGGTREMSLEPYARRFAEAGFRALIFDYRHFGASEGEPRQLFSVRRQLEDWASAIAAARRLEGGDPSRIVLWGTSFSGGYVITAAARDRRVAAVVAQIPMMDALAATWNYVQYAGLGKALKMIACGVVDQARAGLRKPPLCVPIVAPPGQLGAMTTEEADQGYRTIVPADWRNEVSARYALTTPLYRPVSDARKVRCPTLIQVALRDSVAPAGAALRTAERLSEVELVTYDCAHFEFYAGEYFERAVSEQVSFLTRVLEGKRLASGESAA